MSSQDGAEAQNLDAPALYLSPAHIADLIRGSIALPTDEQADLCMEVLRCAVFAMTTHTATELDYPPFALSRGESAALALRVLEGTALLVCQLHGRGSLSFRAARRLTDAIGEAMRQLQGKFLPTEPERPVELCDS